MTSPFQEAIEFRLFMALRGVARRLPYRCVGRLGGSLGRLIFLLTPLRKKVTLENLRHAFPEKTEMERRRLARGAYANFGTALLESFWVAANDAEEIMRRVAWKGDEGAMSLIREGKGFIFLSGHFGSWELFGTSLGLHFGKSILVVVQEQRNPRINRVIDRDRRRHGNRTVPMSRSVREVLTELGGGGIVGMLSDQSGPKESAVVPFFGRPAATHRGVAAFSIKLDAPIFMAFTIRQSDGTYILELQELDRSDLGGPPEEQIDQLTRRHVELFERFVRKYPDHWLWMHKRWKHTQYFESVGGQVSLHHSEDTRP
ncbi:MAG: lysophospholipid acyltransferase family protein [Bacteroidota bacterium]